ncbi:hypothetical protein [Paenibacillus xylanilyticus]|uniref:Uncharacterized protein n=1 Tax=Paenibacillus xylanilyticus TaxID=248903 RepID=A0A7Y6C4A8_9BACL|nr:hypothetical protein [Paenibacillus xylanilyticus]NUU79565.1 hypothetical protein [Paenibacillus xylanilyticus]
MKKFFGIILILISSLTILFSLFLVSEGTDVAVISTIIFFIPGVIVLVTGIKMCSKPKFHPNVYGADYYHHQHPNHDEYYEEEYDEEYAEHEEEFEEPQEPVSVNCPGCGAKAKVYQNMSTECEYCGTTVRAS